MTPPPQKKRKEKELHEWVIAWRRLHETLLPDLSQWYNNAVMRKKVS